MFNDKLSIAVIDDDAGDVEILRRQLSSICELKFDLHPFHDSDGIVDQAALRTADVIFIDYRLGDKTGLDVLESIRLSGLKSPVVMLTGHGDEMLATRCLKCGADDYLCKRELTTVALRHAIQHAQSQQGQRHTEAELRLIQYSVDHASVPVFWVREDSLFTYVNETACRWFGYRREDLLAMTFMDIVPSVLPTMWREWWHRITSAGAARSEAVFRRNDGTTFPAEINIQYVEYEGQRRIWAFLREMNERKRNGLKEDEVHSGNVLSSH